MNADTLQMRAAPPAASASDGARCDGAARPSPQVYADAVLAAGGRVVAERLHPDEPACVGAALYATPAGALHVPALANSRLSIRLTAGRLSGGLEGQAQQAFRAARYALFGAPAGTAAHWHHESPSRHLSLFFDATTLADEGFAQPAFGLDGEPLLNLSLPGIRPLADELLAELEAGPLWSAEAADSLGRLLLIRVVRQRARQRVSGNPLTPRLLARVFEHVQAHLSERILVGDLAAVAGLSPNRFAQAYTACTGQSPHQFVLAQRLRRAQALLEDDELPLAQVAADCGFASQQHLTQVMRKRLGITPSRYRNGQGTSGRAAAVQADRAGPVAWPMQAAA